MSHPFTKKLNLPPHWKFLVFVVAETMFDEGTPADHSTLVDEFCQSIYASSIRGMMGYNASDARDNVFDEWICDPNWDVVFEHGSINIPIVVYACQYFFKEHKQNPMWAKDGAQFANMLFEQRDIWDKYIADDDAIFFCNR